LREYGFTITEHDPERPWIVLAREHRTVRLPEGLQFFTPRWSVELDPWPFASAWPR